MSVPLHRCMPIVAAAILLGACAKKEEPAPPPAPAAAAPVAGAETIGPLDAEKVLNVYNWSDYIDPEVVPAFEKATGIKVNYDLFDSNEVVETKLLAGRTGYDVVVPSASFLKREIASGVIAQLDKSKIPNLKNMDPEISKQIQVHDADNAHGVNYFWGTSGVGYNEEKIKSAMPDAPVDSFAMFYDPEVIAHFKGCGVAILDAPSEVVGTVLMYLGKDPNSEAPEDLAAAEKILLSIRKNVRYINSSKYIEDLANGEICLALGWSGDVFQARDRAEEAGKGIKLKYNIPKEGAITFFDMLAVPKDAAHPLNAHAFINYLMRPEVAAKNSSFVHYANSNKASYDLIDPEVRNDPAVYPPPEIMAKLKPDIAESQAFSRLLTASWRRFKTGK